ncbi:twin-arginine translocation pathway signal protein [Pseudomonas sp. RIT-PI-AD]|uniref:twin-arginine translocation pathway signal protein n=1 Tax=Pseudomonas sp. RIT-PI-AD TaxID=3035294 RepID=UPI0021D7D732|nr:twin-arginine translocation pathway signal protein [Pseudomonas sp. RIT-PI-AD]
MTATTPDHAGLSRRGLLKVGLLGGALLGSAGLAASLGGCSASGPAPGFRCLRAGDLDLLRALIPVVLAGAVAAPRMPEAVSGTLASIDRNLDHLSPEMLKLSLQLFDVLVLPLTRGPLTGIWGAWANASAEDLRRFLERWRDSSIGLLKMGHGSLLQLVSMSWYGRPESWAHCGYPGPPTV